MPRLPVEPAAPGASSAPGSDPARPPRKVSRRRAADPRRIALIGTGAVEAELADLSSHGCCLTLVSGALRIGAVVGLPLQERTVLRAIVRWVRDGQAGLEFFQAIPATLVEEWA